MLKKFIVVSLATAFLNGCATNYANKTPEQVAKAMTVTSSEFDSGVAYVAPRATSNTSRGLFTDYETTYLAARLDKKTKQISYYVYVSIQYSFDWRFYNSVSFNDGSSREVTDQKRAVNSCAGMGCIHTEEVYFQVEYSRLNPKEGLTFRLNSKSGTQNVIKLPPGYVQGFISGLSQRLKAG